MTLDLKYSLVNSFICFQVSSSNSLLLSRILFSELNFFFKRRISVVTYCLKVKLNFLCGFMATLYDAPVFWILWKLRFWSCASLSFIRTKVVWYICSQSGTFKAIFRYYETSYNLHITWQEFDLSDRFWEASDRSRL